MIEANYLNVGQPGVEADDASAIDPYSGRDDYDEEDLNHNCGSNNFNAVQEDEDSLDDIFKTSKSAS